MSVNGPEHDGPVEQEPLEELFETVFDLADEIASRINRDQVEARLRRTLEEASHHQEPKPARKAARPGRVSTASHNDPSVAVLVGRAAAGNEDAWHELVDRYAPLIWTICRRYRLDRSDAEDVGQKVWLRLAAQLDNLHDPAALPGWLATTTRRECLRVLTERGSERLAGLMEKASSTAAPPIRKPRKKVCLFCQERVVNIDYKDTSLLRKFISDRGKIRARRVTGNCTRHQRDLAVAIKAAREMSMLPTAHSYRG